MIIRSKSAQDFQIEMFNKSQMVTAGYYIKRILLAAPYTASIAPQTAAAYSGITTGGATTLGRRGGGTKIYPIFLKMVYYNGSIHH